MKATRATQRVKVTVGDRQVVSLAGLHLLGSLADRLGLSAGYSAAVPPVGERAPVHDRGRLLVQVAVMLAGGGRCVADMAALRDQPALFGEVGLRADDLAGLRRHRHRRPRRAAGGAGRGPGVGRGCGALRARWCWTWMRRSSSCTRRTRSRRRRTSRADTGSTRCSASATAARPWPGILPPGNATANSGADQLAVVDLAIAGLPEPYQRGHRPGEPAEAVEHPVLVRADSAGAVRGFIDGLLERNCAFSVSARVSDRLDAARSSACGTTTAGVTRSS